MRNIISNMKWAQQNQFLIYSLFAKVDREIQMIFISFFALSYNDRFEKNAQKQDVQIIPRSTG